MLIIENRVWVGKLSGEISLFTLDLNEQIVQEASLKEHKRKVTQFLVVNETVLSSAEDGTIIVWNKKVGEHFGLLVLFTLL